MTKAKATGMRRRSARLEAKATSAQTSPAADPLEVEVFLDYENDPEVKEEDLDECSFDVGGVLDLVIDNVVREGHKVYLKKKREEDKKAAAEAKRVKKEVRDDKVIRSTVARLVREAIKMSEDEEPVKLVESSQDLTVHKRGGRVPKRAKGNFSETDTGIPWIKRIRIDPGLDNCRVYNCSLCFASFSRPDQIEHHLKFRHGDIVDIELRKAFPEVCGRDAEWDLADTRCRYCGKEQKSKFDWMRHSLEVHTLFKSHVCVLCPGWNGFGTKEQGYVHVLQSHKEIFEDSSIEAGLTIKSYVKQVTRPLPVHIAVNPVPKHLYFVSEE